MAVMVHEHTKSSNESAHNEPWDDDVKVYTCSCVLWSSEGVVECMDLI